MATVTTDAELRHLSTHKKDNHGMGQFVPENIEPEWTGQPMIDDQPQHCSQAKEPKLRSEPDLLFRGMSQGAEKGCGQDITERRRKIPTTNLTQRTGTTATSSDSAGTAKDVLRRRFRTFLGGRRSRVAIGKDRVRLDPYNHRCGCLL